MKRRHRRRLLNFFAFALLGYAIYLNMFKMHSDDAIPGNKATITAQARPHTN